MNLSIYKIRPDVVRNNLNKPLIKDSEISFQGLREVAAIGAGLAVTGGALYAGDIFINKSKTEKTTLKELVSNDLPMKAGIEIEFFMPKGWDKADLVKYLKKEVFDVYYKEKKSILVGLEFMDDHLSKAPQAEFMKSILEKMERGLDNGNPEIPSTNNLTPEEKELYERLILINSQSTLNGDGFYFKILHGDKSSNEEAQKWTLIVDASVRPWHRTVELVTPPLKTKEDLELFAFISSKLKALEPRETVGQKVRNFFKNIGTQLGYRISSEDKYNRSGFEASKLGPPGYQGEALTTTGYGSVHFHHDATDESPVGFLNEINQYYNWQNFLHNYFHPGLSRINFGNPMKKEYIEEINKVAVPMIKEGSSDEKIWAAMAKIFLKYFNRHEELKYQALNQVNKLMLPISKLNLPHDQLPETLRGKVGEKAGKKITMEWRINPSELDPQKVLLLNKLFQNMAQKAVGLAEKGEIIEIKPHKYKPWTKKKLLKEFCNQMDLKYVDFKDMQKPAWDKKILDDIIANNSDDKLKPLGYPEVHLSSLRTTIPNIKNWIKERLGLLKEPEVITSAALGAITTFGVYEATKSLEERKVKDFKSGDKIKLNA
ncbi:MAG: hypothetical protein AB1782_01575 [Cyanobacteriota bacterium]